LATEFQIGGVYDTVQEMYDKAPADLVVVAVPELATNAVCRACFEFPWYALVEKPVGYNLADAEDIESQARATSARVYVALNRRSYSSTMTALHDLTTIEGKRFIHVQDQEDQIRALQAGQPKKVVENWMFANSIHIIDYLVMFGRGSIVKVNKLIPWDPERPWLVLAQIEYDSGDVGFYEGVWNSPGPWSASILTKDKRWELRPLEKASYQSAGQRTQVTVATHEWDQVFKPGLRRQAELAIQEVGGQKTELPTLQEALKSMKLVQEIYS
jgi:predicted dehydrogenase